MDDADLGTLTRQGDRWTLTFTRRLAHPREKVWRAVTEPEHLAAWYPQEIVGERRAGAPLRFVSSAGDGFPGQMLVFDPPETMEFTFMPPRQHRCSIVAVQDPRREDSCASRATAITAAAAATRITARTHRPP